MSHWKTYQNNVLKNTNMEIFKKAVENLGLQLDTTIKKVQNSYGKSDVDMGLRKNGSPISIGFKANKEGILELRGDFWGTGLSETNLLNQIAQQYNKEDIIKKLARTSQYSVTDVVTNKSGEIELTVACL